VWGGGRGIIEKWSEEGGREDNKGKNIAENTSCRDFQKSSGPFPFPASHECLFKDHGLKIRNATMLST
jgi:hypothetical protein